MIARRIALYITLIFFWICTLYVFWPQKVKNTYLFISNTFSTINIKKINSGMTQQKKKMTFRGWFQEITYFHKIIHKKNKKGQVRQQQKLNIKFNKLINYVKQLQMEFKKTCQTLDLCDTKS